MPGDNIKNPTLITRQKFKTLETEASEQIVSLDDKCLYRKTLVSEAIENALRWLYSCDTPPNIERLALMLQLKLAVAFYLVLKLMGTGSIEKIVSQRHFPINHL